jgi:hypothetical protein
MFFFFSQDFTGMDQKHSEWICKSMMSVVWRIPSLMWHPCSIARVHSMSNSLTSNPSLVKKAKVSGRRKDCPKVSLPASHQIPKLLLFHCFLDGGLLLGKPLQGPPSWDHKNHVSPTS